MAGIYLHIPFCTQKCYYCDFYSNNQLGFKGQFLEALLKEIQDKSPLFSAEKIDTIYFGGGTPSLLRTDELEEIFDAIFQSYPLNPGTEITFEVNPEDITPAYLESIRILGVNRLSMGIQSLNDSMLKFLHRRHSAGKAVQSLKMARRSGFDNLSADLIYGIPNQEIEDFEDDVQTLFELGIEHLSAYHLSIEPGTVFGKRHAKGTLLEIDDEKSSDFYKRLCELTHRAGFEHYEISNFALPGFRSKHNSAYWNNIPYLGFGPSAHSYFNGARSWNIASTKRYIDKISAGETYFEQEHIDPKMAYNECLLTRLRISDGLSLPGLQEKFGTGKLNQLLKEIKVHRLEEYFEKKGESLRIKEQYWLISNRIILNLIEA